MVNPGHSVNDQRTTSLSTDELLQASRRVDWRFLFPDPRLDRIACLKPIKETLVHALTPFCSSMEIIDPHSDLGRPASYDLLVMQQPAFNSFLRYRDLIRQGGFLYIEAYSPFSTLWIRKPSFQNQNGRLINLRTAPQYTTAIRRAGFDDIQVYWAWPDFEVCTKFIPIDQETPLVYALAQNRTGWLSMLKSALARWSVRSGILRNWMPAFSIVAVRGLA